MVLGRHQRWYYIMFVEGVLLYESCINLSTYNKYINVIFFYRALLLVLYYIHS